MPVRRRELRERRPEVSEADWLIASESEVPPELHDKVGFLSLMDEGGVWERARDVVIPWWIERSPGTRPALWWTYDAPGPRQRLGGIGTPQSECFGNVESLHCGIPNSWLSASLKAYFTGQQRHAVTGERLNPTRTEADFPYPVIDPYDPPRYESQASYLDRHGLLTAAERRDLKRDGWPDDESVEMELGESEEAL